MPAELSVACNVPDCEVLIDGESTGIGPVETWLEPGEHMVRIESKGRDAWQTRLTLKPGENLTVNAELTPLVVAQIEAGGRPDPMLVGAGISMGTGSAMVVAGVVLSVLGHQGVSNAGDLDQLDYSDYDSFRADFDAKIESAKIKAYTGYGFVGLGAVTVITGTILYFMTDDNSGDDSGVKTMFFPSGPSDGPGITARLSW